MNISTNFKDYIAGKARLENAVHIDPNDKIQNFLKGSMNHRFWATDYNSFKKGLLKETPMPKVNTDSGAGVNESMQVFESREPLHFKTEVHGADLSLYNLPREIYENPEDKLNTYTENERAEVDYQVELEYNDEFVENLYIKFTRVEVFLDAMNPDEEADDMVADPHHFRLSNFDNYQPEINVLHAPYYLTDLTIDCKSTMDQTKWVIKSAIFGKDKDY